MLYAVTNIVLFLLIQPTPVHFTLEVCLEILIKRALESDLALTRRISETCSPIEALKNLG